MVHEVQRMEVENFALVLMHYLWMDEIVVFVVIVQRPEKAWVRKTAFVNPL